MATTTDNSLEQMPRWKVALRALRHRNYQLFFCGQGLSLIGTWMQMVAQSWLVYRLTGSSVLLGAVGFTSQFPVLLIAPFAGHAADRYRRRTLIITTQTASLLQAFLLAGLVLTGTVRVWHLFVLAATLGVINGFDVPARQSFIVHMVGREDLMNALALNASIYNGARIVGPAVAGILVAKIGEGWCFFANGVSYIAVLAGLLMMRVTETPRPAGDSPLKSIQEGFRYSISTRPIRSLFLLLALASIAAMPYVVLMPIFAAEVLHGDSRSMGMLFGATGVGAIIGLMVLASRPGVKGLSRWVMWGAIGFGISLMAFSLSRTLWLSMALLLPVGAFMLVHMSGTNTLIQSMVPDRLRGRVMSVYAMMFQGMAPFGALLAGFLGDHLGAPAAVMISGAACLVGGAVFGVFLPDMRPELRELVQAQGLASEVAAGEAAATQRPE
jgi:MFS family permease